MEHETFGKIVAALRREHIDFATGRRWSQQKLAEETGLTKRIVSKIERGRQARLEGVVLQELARAFELTSLERREFFAMASQSADRAVVRADLDHREVFEKTWASLGAVGLPAFLMDAFGNIIGINRAMVAFHGCSMAQISEAKSTAEGVNLLGMLFAPDSTLRRVLGNGWHSNSMTVMRQWRAMTLRYRHTERFRQLFTALSAFPDFPMFWSASRERRQDVNSRLRSHIYTHRLHGAGGLHSIYRHQLERPRRPLSIRLRPARPQHYRAFSAAGWWEPAGAAPGQLAITHYSSAARFSVIFRGRRLPSRPRRKRVPLHGGWLAEPEEQLVDLFLHGAAAATAACVALLYAAFVGPDRGHVLFEGRVEGA